MLIPTFEVEIFTPPCEPGAERFAGKAHFTVDISEVLPLLNATLKGAEFHRAAMTLTWKKGGHNIAFHPFEIGTSNAADRGTAEAELKSLVELVNRTWERRASIEPDFEAHQRPAPMAVYQILPQTNCRRCGEPTCFTFALKLAASQVEIAGCPAIFEPAFEMNLQRMQGLLIEAPAMGRKE